MIEKVYYGEILGEEASLIKAEFRPLYFGLKNIVLKEIESIDKDIDIQKFFFDTTSAENRVDAAILSQLLPIPTLIKSQTLNNNGVSPMTNGDAGMHHENTGEADFSNVVKKMTSIRR